jgi:enterochelin esterase-like enzyme
MAVTVTHTGTAPTGYEVTFRYLNAAARSVAIKGEWFFARPSDLSPQVGTPEQPVVESQGLLPWDWQPGDIPMAHPNGTGPNWPVVPMIRDGAEWTFTTPLPSGVFTYALVVDAGDPIADPENLPWNQTSGEFRQPRAPNSQVFVPADRKFRSLDYAWQGPAPEAGWLTHVTYPSPGHGVPAEQNYAVVYTPPGYDRERPQPYRTLYLSHGGGENELGWTTQGVAHQILDNLIGFGEIEPLVVVMPNAQGRPEAPFGESYDQDVIQNLIPFIESRYNVEKSARGRAFGGLSMGGMLTNSFMIKHPQVFDYYGMMSAGLPAAHETLTEAEIAGLRGKGIFIGSGWQDTGHAAGYRDISTGTAREISTLTKAGLPITINFVHGGHDWHVWRLLLRDFLTRVAFQPPAHATWK